MAARSRHPTLRPTTPKRVHQQDTTPTSPTSNLNGGAQPPPHTQPDNPKARSSTRHNANTSHLLSQWRREAAQPTLSPTAQKRAHRPDTTPIYPATNLNGVAQPPTYNQPDSPEKRVHHSYKAITYLITVVKAVRAPQHLPSDNPNCELIVRQGATTSRFQFLWLRIAVYPHPARPTKATCS